jgi:hypothetical protein
MAEARWANCSAQVTADMVGSRCITHSLEARSDLADSSGRLVVDGLPLMSMCG